MKIKNLKLNMGYKKGISLYLALMIMTILLGIALGINSIFLGQTKTLKEIGHSVIAFYAADAGIEEILINRSNPISTCTEVSPCVLDNGSQYFFDIKTAGPNCQANYYCIKSIGEYINTRRAIEIEY